MMLATILAIRAIWECWDGNAPLDFRGEFYTHTLMTPVFVPGPHRFGRAPIHVAGVGPAMHGDASGVRGAAMLWPL